MNNRINYFDIIKTVSVFLIVYVHYPLISGSVGSNVSMLVTIIGVPLFLMVNGALLFRKELVLKKHFNKIRNYFFSLIVLKLLILVICIITKRVDIAGYNYSDLFMYLLTNKNLDKVPAEHLWFMYMLLKIYLIFPFIYIVYTKNKKYLKYIFIFCIIFSFGIEILNDFSLILNKLFKIPVVSFNAIIEAYSPLGNILQYLTYFILGYYLYKKYETKKLSKIKIVGLFSLYLIGLSMIFLSRYMQTGNFLTGPYVRVQNDYSKIGDLIMSSSVFIIISQIKLKNYKFFNYIGSRTLNIYYVHMIIVAYIFTYLLPYFNKYTGMKLNFIRTIIVIIISIIITEILKKIPGIRKIFS